MDAGSIDNVKASLMGRWRVLAAFFFWEHCVLSPQHRYQSGAERQYSGADFISAGVCIAAYSGPLVLCRWGYVLGTGVLQRIQQAE